MQINDQPNEPGADPDTWDQQGESVASTTNRDGRATASEPSDGVILEQTPARPAEQFSHQSVSHAADSVTPIRSAPTEPQARVASPVSAPLTSQRPPAAARPPYPDADPFNPREVQPRIVVVGVGGAGGNAINNMIEHGLEGVEFVAANTDAQALAYSQAPQRLQLGCVTTGGFGAGCRPARGEASAEESAEAIADLVTGAHMVFIAAGMGGGTGTGAAPVVGRIARECGALTVGVVTKPFTFEGPLKMRIAQQGIEKLSDVVDAQIVIPNQNLYRVIGEDTSFIEAFRTADEVLHQGVRSITDLVTRPGHVNLDFADVRTIMENMGTAIMGAGEAEGENRALLAAEAAICNPLFDNISVRGARSVLVNVASNGNMSLREIDAAISRIQAEALDDAMVACGVSIDPSLGDYVRVSVVATGVEGVEMQRTTAPTRPAPQERPLELRAAVATQPAHSQRAAPAAAAPQPDPRVGGGMQPPASMQAAPIEPAPDQLEQPPKAPARPPLRSVIAEAARKGLRTSAPLGQARVARPPEQAPNEEANRSTLADGAETGAVLGNSLFPDGHAGAGGQNGAQQVEPGFSNPPESEGQTAEGDPMKVAIPGFLRRQAST